jgi:hypothetical protein
VPTDCNLADMGTWPTVQPDEMGEDSDYQNGMEWMRRPEEEWPVKKTVTPPPCGGVQEGHDAGHAQGGATAEVAAVQAVKSASWPPYPPKASSLAKLTRVYAYVLWFLARARRRPGCEKRPMMEKPPAPPRECMEAAKWMLIEAAQKELPLRKMECLMAEKRTRTCVLGVERTLLVVCGRSKRYRKVAYDQEYLLVLSETHPLSRLYLVDSHARDHGGADSMVMRSRSNVWIMAARRLAKQVRDHCFTCRYLAKKCGEQLMGPLPEHRMGPAPVFESTAVDLFGPLSFRIRTTRGGRARPGESSSCEQRHPWFMWR